MPAASRQYMLRPMADHRILIAGGGVAALEAAVALRALGGTEAQAVLVCPGADFTLRALQVAEPFGRRAPVTFPVTEILDGLGVDHLQDTVSHVDSDGRVVLTVGGHMLPYDSLLLAVGGIGFPAYGHGITFDRPGDPAAFMILLDDVRAGLVASVAFV
ncbi:MAG: sulfide:quinone oxidoreductase, partial [Solirubrobacteraceae bacterium]|nr:sulfide:quinone oxidoreductase [Solirubrobacteraceae bacterium]